PAMGEYVPAPGQDPSKLGGMGGVYNIINLHTYHYAGNNPIKYIDPDGRESRSVPPDVARILDERDKVADFYNEVIENGHMVFMGSHNVQIPNVGLDTGRRHSAIIIFVAPGSSFYDNELFVDNTITGSDIRFATLGAGPKDLNKYIFGELFAEPNHSFDVWTVNGTQISSRLQRVNANHEQVSLLIRNDRYFRDNNNARLRYTATPASRTSSYNSNSYTYSLFRSSTIAPPELSDSLYPCWGKEIPRHFFIRTGTLY
ncbi:MAG: hypothetical protein FWD28_10945, partial [Treponema sp.]|nr:hypothetical protein [Treponema sp.]